MSALTVHKSLSRFGIFTIRQVKEDLRMDFRSRLILVGVATLFTTASVDAQQPVDNSFTGLALVSLEQARSAGDSVTEAEAYGRALGMALDGIRSDPENSQSHAQAGQAYIGLGRYEEAVTAFDTAVELWPDYLNETMSYRENGWVNSYNKAIEYLDSDEDMALALMTKANVLIQERPEAYLSIGSILSNKGDTEGALESFMEVVRAVEQPPRREREEEVLTRWATYRTTALLNIGNLYLNLDRPADAIDAYQTVLDTDPDHPQATSNMAIALAMGGEGAAALSMYEEMMENPASSEFDFFNAGVGFYQAEVWDRAAVAFMGVIERNPMQRDALQNMSQSLLSSKQYEALLPYSSQLLEMDPQNDYAFRLHAQALVQTGSTDEAVALMEEMETLTFLVDNLRIVPMGDTGARVEGVVVNKTLEEGASVSLRFHFFDRTGAEVGTGDVEVVTGGVDVAMAFQLEHSSEAGVGGYSYEVIESDQ